MRRYDSDACDDKRFVEQQGAELTLRSNQALVLVDL